MGRSLDPEQATFQELIDEIGGWTCAPGIQVVRAIRDRLARLVLAEPDDAYRVARILLDAVQAVASAPEALATAWRSFAEASIYQGRMGEASKAYETATRWAEQGSDPRLLGEILVGRVGVVANQGRDTAARKLAERAHQILEDAGHLEYVARLHMNLGSAAYHREHYVDALADYRKALDIFQQLDRRDPMVLGLRINFGVACTELSMVAEARRHFLNAEALSDELGLSHLQAQARFNRAVLEALQGDYRLALELLSQAERTFEDEHATALSAATLLTRSEIHIELGLAEEAYEDALTAAELYRSEDMSLDASLCDLAAARARRLLGYPKEARQRLSDLEESARSSGLLVRAARIGGELARVLLEIGSLEEAERHAIRAGRELTEMGLIESAALARCTAAAAARHQRDPGRAKSLIEPALRSIRRIPVPGRITVWQEAGRLEAEDRDPRRARRHFEKAMVAIEQQRQLIPGIELRAAAFRAHVGVYSDALDAVLDGARPNAESVFRIAECARARAFRERMARSERDATKSDHVHAMRERTIASHAAQSDHDDQGAELDDERSRLAALTRKLETVETATQTNVRGKAENGEAAELRRAILKAERSILRRVRGAAHGDDASWSHTIKLAEVQAHLGARQVLVEYFVTRTRIVAIVATRRRSHIRVLGQDRSGLERDLRRFQSQIESLVLARGRSGFNLEFAARVGQATLQSIYDRIFAPIEDLVAGSAEILLVPHDVLHEVPFECLHDGKTYLSDRYRLRRIPTGDFIVRRTAEDSPSPELGPGVSGQECVILSTEQRGPAGAALETAAIERILGDRAQLIRDPDATDVLTSLERRRWIHWTTHGIFRNDNPLFSHLAVQDGELYVVDLQRRRADVDLMVLSACSTGRVAIQRSDDLAGISHTFLEIGVRRLVASLWRVDDEATTEMMTRFYDAILRHPERRLADALHEARVATRETWPHPYFWGGFAVFG